ncbi:ribosomal protein rps13 [Cyclospora cayetanensis]|uniref:Ribosomal protein rps13 n=1 Tax=Cyclospora cayetanensis TaxID=88456 RepID=A0A1D3CV11_9EIME|nr:ribosomal protein rps13 [Cyclospora cayetanensis]
MADEAVSEYRAQAFDRAAPPQAISKCGVEINKRARSEKATMGRMYGNGKGMSAPAPPFRRRPPSWLRVKHQEVEEHILKLAKKGQTPSQAPSGLPTPRLGKGAVGERLLCRSQIHGDGREKGWIGVTLRDQFGIPQVKSVTGSKILRILKNQGVAPEIPEDLYFLIKKAVAIRKHLEKNRKDRDSKFRLILVESKIHRLGRYYRRTKQLPATWKYQSSTASALVA